MGYTPGPWWVEVSDDGEQREVYDGFGHTATVYGESATAADNARLIANAPDMLSCLRAALAAFQELDDGWRDMDATLVDQIVATNLHAIGGIVRLIEGRSTDNAVS